MFVFTRALPLRAFQKQHLGVVRTVGRRFHTTVSHPTQGSCGSSSPRTQASCEADSWQHIPASAHILHAQRASTTTAMEIAIRARTSQATRTTRAVAGQARLDAVGRAFRDTIKVAGLAIDLAVVACAAQGSTASLVHATHAQTNQVIPFTPVTGEQAQMDAHGVVLMDIFRMETSAHIHITMMHHIQTMLCPRYFEALLAV